MFGIRKSLYLTSIINVNTKLKGSITAEGELQINGMIDGNIICNKVVIGVTGCVTGTINAQKVIVNGAVFGDIHTSSIILGKTCNVKGDIYHNYISIITGASIEGDLKKKTIKSKV